MFLGDRMTRTYGTKNTRAVLKQEMENCNRTENISQSAHLGSVPTLYTIVNNSAATVQYGGSCVKTDCRRGGKNTRKCGHRGMKNTIFRVK